ncbi:MAG: Mut7-C RNAse domain-containing protein [Polaromonas sp.]|nr:Mut7-C RNAse domain-containing protein [Polaromonas sp.]
MPRLPPAVQTSHEHFTHCRLCGRVYWQGSHGQHMQHVLDAAVRQSTF